MFGGTGCTAAHFFSLSVHLFSLFSSLFHASSQVFLKQFFFFSLVFSILSLTRPKFGSGGLAGGVGERVVCVQTGHEA